VWGGERTSRRSSRTDSAPPNNHANASEVESNTAGTVRAVRYSRRRNGKLGPAAKVFHFAAVRSSRPAFTITSNNQTRLRYFVRFDIIINRSKIHSQEYTDFVGTNRRLFTPERISIVTARYPLTTSNRVHGTVV